MSRPAKKSIAHPLLEDLRQSQERLEVMQRRVEKEQMVRLEAIRAALAAGLTQADCARAMGISRHQTLQLVKRNGLAPTPEGPPDLGEDCHRCGAPGWIVRRGTILLCTDCARGRTPR